MSVVRRLAILARVQGSGLLPQRKMPATVRDLNGCASMSPARNLEPRERSGHIAAPGEDEVFGWRLIKGEPFYFFRRSDTTGVSYSGQILPHKYDDVIHYRCCEPAAFNVQGNEDMVWFHALRGGTYYYVEMGLYEAPAGGEEQTATSQ